MDDIYGYLRYTANLISQSHFHNKMILKGGSVLISKLIECGRKICIGLQVTWIYIVIKGSLDRIL